MNPSLVDLTTVAAVKSWMSAYGDASLVKSDDANIQLAITSASREWMRYTGRGPKDWQITNQSPFSQALSFDETYDGHNNDRLFLDQFPVLSVASVTVNGVPIPPSTGATIPGWAMHSDRKSLILRSYRFHRGTQNVEVTYSAGFTAQIVTGEVQNVPGTPGAWAAGNIGLNQIIFDGVNVQQCVKAGQTGTVSPLWQTVIGEQTPDSRATWECLGPLSQYYVVRALQAPVLLDGTVAYFADEAPLLPVLVAPSVGEYCVLSTGAYLFSAADAGAQIVLSYTATGAPEDIQLRTAQMVATSLIRRKHWDLKSEAIAALGTTAYRDWALAPEITQVMDYYKRWH
jgi:hypothetical protein